MQEKQITEAKIDITDTKEKIGNIKQNATHKELSDLRVEKSIFTKNSIFESNEYSNTKTTNYQSLNEQISNSNEIYTFTKKGKYTNQFFSTYFRKNIDSEGSVFKFDEIENMKCKEHLNYNEYIVCVPFGKYKLYETICNECESEYSRQRKIKGLEPLRGCRLMTEVIRNNGEKILQIKNGTLPILNEKDASQCTSILFDEIIPLADELIGICEDFYEEVACKFDSSTEENDELLKLKKFIDEIPLNDKCEPNVYKIGENPELKYKYVKLAIFLLKYQGSKINSDFKNLSLKFKSHIIKIIELRKTIVIQLSKWLKFIMGGFYDFIFKSEGISIDDCFRESIIIDYLNEEEIKKLRLFYENQIEIKNEKISELEKRNEELLKKLESLEEEIVCNNDLEGIINDLRLKLRQLEEEWLLQKETIENLNIDKGKLITENSEQIKLIQDMKKEFENFKNNLGMNLKSAIIELKTNYESQISQLNIQINEWKTKYSEFELRYSNEYKQLQAEKDGITNKIQILIQQNSQEINTYKEKITVQITENNNLKNEIQKLKQDYWAVTQERDKLFNTIESLKIQIKEYQDNINNITNQFNISIKAKDNLTIQINDLNDQITLYKAQISKMTNDISMYTKNIEIYNNNINSITNERDELRQRIQITQNELREKSLELQNIINIRISLDNKIGHLEGEIKRITDIYQKVALELNQKLVIIGDLEKKNKDLDLININFRNQTEIHITNVQKYEKLMIQINEDNRVKVAQMEKEIFEFREKERESLIIINERDSEINRLKIIITNCRDEWNKLTESYESLLVDIQNQISINELLRKLVFELLGKIEMHNQNVGGLDLAIKQQIEILTKQSLAKKNIEIDKNYSKDVSQAANTIDALRNKMGRIESQKLHKSEVFTEIDLNIENFKNTSSSRISSNYELQRLNNGSLQRSASLNRNIEIRKYNDGFKINSQNDLKKEIQMINSGNINNKLEYIRISTNKDKFGKGILNETMSKSVYFYGGKTGNSNYV